MINTPFPYTSPIISPPSIAENSRPRLVGEQRGIVCKALYRSTFIEKFGANFGGLVKLSPEGKGAIPRLKHRPQSAEQGFTQTQGGK